MAEDNLGIIRRWYETLDPTILDEDVDWKLAEGFPSGGHYRGRRAVLEDWWPRHAALFDAWKAIPGRLLDAGEAVVVLGRYTGTARATGQDFQVPFAHVWWMRDGQIVALGQYVDTLLLQRVLAPAS